MPPFNVLPQAIHLLERDLATTTKEAQAIAGEPVSSGFMFLPVPPSPVPSFDVAGEGVRRPSDLQSLARELLSSTFPALSFQIWGSQIGRPESVTLGQVCDADSGTVKFGGHSSM